ncbi:hypothetical protein [Celerinatantimonas sp. YJH-8]|uniref:hypothetical protein n=1 Tax=Celerinatantimonas sp. YJH-8 TaxID=3228714 RepID=UPI0038C807FC
MKSITIAACAAVVGVVVGVYSVSAIADNQPGIQAGYSTSIGHHGYAQHPGWMSEHWHEMSQWMHSGHHGNGCPMFDD